MHDNSDYGKGVAEDAKRFLEPLIAAGKTKLVYYDAITGGETDYTAALQKLKTFNVVAGSLMLNEPMPQFLNTSEATGFFDAYKKAYGELPGSIWVVYAADGVNALVVSALGISIVIQNAVMVIWGPRYQSFPAALVPHTSFGSGDFRVTYLQIFILVFSLLLMGGIGPSCASSSSSGLGSVASATFPAR